ncbi:MAG: hypothetical protein OHK0052_06000 [Anaerolineales bacterium]
MDWTLVIVILQLIFLEGILSIDNAAVIGALVTPLPNDQPIPWHKSFARLGHWLDPIFGNQRVAALRVGLLGAYVGRGLMLVLAGFVIQNPWIKIIGALYLIRLAFDSLSEASHGGVDEDDEQIRPIKTQTFWMTVLTVETMDLIFSIDNVVTAVSLSDKMWVVLLGVGIGILTMRFAAGLFSYAVEREPILKQAAYILVLNIGVELILEEVLHVEVGDLTRFLVSIGTIALALLYAHSRVMKKFNFVLFWFGQGFGIMNELMDWAFAPFMGVLRLGVRGTRYLLRLGRAS